MFSVDVSLSLSHCDTRPQTCPERFRPGYPGVGTKVKGRSEVSLISLPYKIVATGEPMTRRCSQ